MFKKITLGLFALFLFPVCASAHEMHVYQINGAEYEIEVGSITEPVITEDTNGVYVSINRNGAPFVGGSDAVHVEMSAGSAKRTLNLEPFTEDQDGQYVSKYIATVPTTIAYRLVGTLEGTPVDLAYTCNAAGEGDESEENTTRTNVSSGVVQTLQSGSFGCPQAREEFGFPEKAHSGTELAKSVDTLSAKVDANASAAAGKNSLINIALALALIACGLGAAAFIRKK